jgi:hypothetical protein
MLEKLERRMRKDDRRQRSEKLPLKDSGGSVILDRRYFPDRRKSHYDPKW